MPRKFSSSKRTRQHHTRKPKSTPYGRQLKPAYERTMAKYFKPATSIPYLLNPMSRATHNVVAPRYFTNLEYGFTGQIGTSQQSSFAVYGNAIHLPGFTGPGGANRFDGLVGFGVMLPTTVATSSLQPIGLSALANLYQEYRVYGATITVEFFPTEILSATGTYEPVAPIVVNVCPTVDLLTSGDVQLMTVQPYCQSKVVTAYKSDNKITSKMDTCTLNGISKTQFMADGSWSAFTNSNPASLWGWNISSYSLNTTSLAITCGIRVTVNYDVEFFGPKTNFSNS